MKRREFSVSLAGAGLGWMLAGSAHAQGEPVEGTHYRRLAQPAPVSLPSPDKKVEVVDFFWYECSHCNNFLPMVEPWAAKLPADVAYRRVPVGFTARHQAAQKIFYALEDLGLLDTMHKRIFAAIHVQRQRLSTEKDYAAYLVSQGVDRDKLDAALGSFSVNTKAKRATQVTDAYKIDGTPALGVQGRYWTSGSLAGGFGGMLSVTEHLIRLARQAA